MTVYVKRSTDSGAPSLTNSAGSLITLLDYLLVTTMGWTKPFTGTNLAAYLQPSGNGFYLRVDDTGANSARVVGYETMSGISTGSGDFPTAAQVSGGLYVDKSTSGTRAWKFFSDGTCFHLFVQFNGTNWNLTSFGDLDSYVSGDAFGTVLIAQGSAGSTATLAGVLAALTSTSSGHYIARGYAQTGTAAAFGKFSDSVRSNGAAAIGADGLTYPVPVDGSLQQAPIWVSEGVNGARGLLKGLWNPLHNRPLTSGDTFSGLDDIAGRDFEAVDYGATPYQMFVETSDTWGGV